MELFFVPLPLEKPLRPLGTSPWLRGGVLASQNNYGFAINHQNNQDPVVLQSETPSLG